MKESTIDDKVLRILRTELRYGFTDRPQFDPADPTYSVVRPARRLARRAREHHAAQERRPPAAARPRQGQDHRHHRPRCVAGCARRWRIVRSRGLRSHQHRRPALATCWVPRRHVLYSRGLPEIERSLPANSLGRPVKAGNLPAPATSPARRKRRRHGHIADYKPAQRGRQRKAPRSIRYSAAFKADKAGSI